MAIMVEQFTLGIWPTPTYHLLTHRHEEKTAHQGRESKYTCTYMWWPRTSARRESRSPRQGVQIYLYVHVVATYDAFQAVLGFLCRHVLRLLTFMLVSHLPHITEWYEDIRRTSLKGVPPDIHARVTFAAYNRMV